MKNTNNNLRAVALPGLGMRDERPQANDECPYDCPDCGKKLTVIKGLWGCLCLWGGHQPTPAIIEEFASDTHTVQDQP